MPDWLSKPISCDIRHRRRRRGGDTITINRSVAQARLFLYSLILPLASLSLIVLHRDLYYHRHVFRRQGSGTSLQKWTGTVASRRDAR